LLQRLQARRHDHEPDRDGEGQRHDPHAWLRDVLTRLPATKARDIGTLLPHTWNPVAG
jgi:hypothetical protein